MYSKWNADGKKVEVIICSGDSDQAGFDKTFDATAPWLAVPFGEKRASVEAAIPCTG